MKPLDEPIKSLDDLMKVWRAIDGGHGYSAPQLFALLIDADGLILPGIVQVYDDEIAAGPDDEFLRHSSSNWAPRSMSSLPAARWQS